MTEGASTWIHDRWHRCHQVPGLSMVQKAVLVAIAAHSDERWEAYPSETTLAEYAACTDRAVRDAVKALEARGVLVLTKRPGFNTRYRINEAALPARRDATMPPQGAPTVPPRNVVPPPPEPDAGGKGVPPPEPGSRPPGTSFQTPRNVVPNPPEPGSGEGTKEGTTQGTNEGTTHTPRVTPTEQAEPHPEPRLGDLWQALTAFTPKPGAWKLTDARRKHLRARLAEHGETAVRDVAEWVQTSTHDRARFLRERGDPDTLLRPEKFATYLGMAAQPAGAQEHARGAPLPNSRPGRAMTITELLAAPTSGDEPPPRNPDAIDAVWRSA